MSYFSDVLVRMEKENYDLMIKALDEIKKGDFSSGLGQEALKLIQRWNSKYYSKNENKYTTEDFTQHVENLIGEKNLVSLDKDYADFKFTPVKWDLSNPAVGFFDKAMRYDNREYDFLRVGETASDIEEEYFTDTYPFHNDDNFFGFESELSQNTETIIKLNAKLLAIREKAEEIFKKAHYLQTQDELINGHGFIVAERIKAECNAAWMQYRGITHVLPSDLKPSSERSTTIYKEAREQAIKDICLANNLPEGLSFVEASDAMRVKIIKNYSSNEKESPLDMLKERAADLYSKVCFLEFTDKLVNQNEKVHCTRIREDYKEYYSQYQAVKGFAPEILPTGEDKKERYNLAKIFATSEACLDAFNDPYIFLHLNSEKAAQTSEAFASMKKVWRKTNQAEHSSLEKIISSTGLQLLSEDDFKNFYDSIMDKMTGGISKALIIKFNGDTPTYRCIEKNDSLRNAAEFKSIKSVYNWAVNNMPLEKCKAIDTEKTNTPALSPDFKLPT